MKTILCYGDSNTWGYDPVASAGTPYAIRHPHDVRWTGVLARELGEGHRVIEEGMNGRTTVLDDPVIQHRNGRAYLPACLESHKPIDLVVLMLGTNDLKVMYNLPPSEIAAGAGQLVKLIKQSESGPKAGAPRILLVSPALVGDFSRVPDIAEKFVDAMEKTRRFPVLYEAIAQQHGCAFLNIQPHAKASDWDGLHFEADQHTSIGLAMASAVRRVLG
ncbi:lysophospholipase L1-like esterase [Roseimicrobium gellanilyticum]|uniref:Lysophospholipase L1-like esterase n=1 Tax=Roseimicrobium gellanilyticum TaxID=748857 RepID=A0A366HIE6_9BACT|nr:SGNH/GDSL hydrolase family protein [Roseimicrobium gellanilyticum]RBP42537.1 lysophospholipase L1-like esterase [Roseimicrobium gellanilyticum]